ncbi:hypothetical protein GCM10009551_082190 [Nocardiopsis tropica]
MVMSPNLPAVSAAEAIGAAAVPTSAAVAARDTSPVRHAVDVRRVVRRGARAWRRAARFAGAEDDGDGSNSIGIVGFP